MTTFNANGVVLGVESFGDDDAPLVLLVGGTTMLSWPDGLCERLAAGGRRVVRYDLRDSGESTTADPEAPAYTLRDLGADAAVLADALGGGPAHLGGIGVGGMVAQVAALDHRGAFSALTLVGTRAVAPGPPDDDLPDHDQATMSRLFAQPMPDWTDREAVAEFAAAGAEILGDDPATARGIAARIWERTPGTAAPVQMANQMGMVFSKLDCRPRWRERLPEIEIPTLVVHGRRGRFFPVGNGEAIAREIPGARLLVLEEAATAIPDAAAGEVAEAMLARSGRGPRVPRRYGIRAGAGRAPNRLPHRAEHQFAIVREQLDVFVEGDELEQVRRIALALPGVTERVSHAEPCFFVQGKRPLCYFHANHRGDGRISLWCPAPPGVPADLTASEPDRFFHPTPSASGVFANWLGVYLETDGDDRVDWDEIAGIVEDAFRAVAPKTLIDELDDR